MQRMKWFLNGIVMICFMDLFIQLPVMGPFAQSLGAGSFQIGLAVGLYSLTNMLGNILAGMWIDRFGGRKILLGGLFLTAAVILLYPIVREPGQLLAVRALHGLTGGLLVPSAFTLVSRYASDRSQGQSMAHSGAAVGVAAILGPAAAGILKASIGLDKLFLATSALLALGGVLVVLAAPRDEGKKPAQVASESAGFTAFIMSLRNRSVSRAYYGAFALMFAMGALTFSLPLKAEALGFPEQTAGMMLSVFGIVAICMFVLPSNRLFDRISPLRLSLMGGAAVLVSLFALSMVSNQVGMFAIMAVYGLGFALLFPSLNALLVSNVSSENKGKAFGMFYALFSLGVVAGSSGIGALTGHYDSVLRLAVGFILISCCALWVWQLLRRENQEETANT